MLERQREGIARAKAQGRYKGRVPTARRQAAEVIRLKAEGVRPTEIAAKLGIGRASVYRALAGQSKHFRPPMPQDVDFRSYWARTD
jgi:DNA invertase Pin-like site-specific DNA recombinase